MNDQVEGFYLPHLGDGLIIATTTLAGQELMKLRLYSEDFAYFPKDNTTAINFMLDNNFKLVSSQKRMRLGTKRNWNPSNIYSRIGGNLG